MVEPFYNLRGRSMNTNPWHCYSARRRHRGGDLLPIRFRETRGMAILFKVEPGQVELLDGAISLGAAGSVAGLGQRSGPPFLGRYRMISRPSEESTRRSTAGGAQSVDSSTLSMKG